MQKLLASAALALTLSITGLGTANADPAHYYATPEKAQQHCPDDVVVWVNIPTHIYHMPGTRWYGATKNGAFVCEKEADDEGDRPARNGQ